jgi:hypothetical protein
MAMGREGSGLIARHRTPDAGARRSNDAVRAVWLLIPLAYACLFAVLRSLGAAGAVVSIGLLAAFGVLFGRRYLQVPLLGFSALAAVYVLMSYLGLLDQNITLLYSRDAIAQQSAYALALPFVVAAFAVYHEGVNRQQPAFVRLESALFLIAAGTKLYDLMFPGVDPVTGEVARQWLGLTQLTNPITLLAFVVVRRVLEVPGVRDATRFGVATILFLTAGSSQSLIIIAALLAILALPAYRREIALFFIFLLPFIAVVLWPFAQEIWVADPNTGIRLFFWHDALSRVWESGGIGVGFGTETIRPIFLLEASDVQIVGVDDPGFIYVGSHNAFVDAGYRMGVIGFLLIVGYIASLFAKVLRKAQGTMGPSLMDCWVACALMMTMMVNVALASVNLFFGTVFLLSWLVFRVEYPTSALLPGRAGSSGASPSPRSSSFAG